MLSTCSDMLSIVRMAVCVLPVVYAAEASFTMQRAWPSKVSKGIWLAGRCGPCMYACRRKPQTALIIPRQSSAAGRASRLLAKNTPCTQSSSSPGSHSAYWKGLNSTTPWDRPFRNERHKQNKNLVRKESPACHSCCKGVALGPGCATTKA